MTAIPLRHQCVKTSLADGVVVDNVDRNISQKTSQGSCARFVLCQVLLWSRKDQFQSYSSGLLQWHSVAHTTVPMSLKQFWMIWANEIYEDPTNKTKPIISLCIWKTDLYLLIYTKTSAWSREISFANSLHFSCRNVLNFRTNYGCDSAVLCAEFENDWSAY